MPNTSICWGCLLVTTVAPILSPHLPWPPCHRGSLNVKLLPGGGWRTNSPPCHLGHRGYRWGTWTVRRLENQTKRAGGEKERRHGTARHVMRATQQLQDDEATTAVVGVQDQSILKRRIADATQPYTNITRYKAPLEFAKRLTSLSIVNQSFAHVAGRRRRERRR